jgi:hypothetical protein
MKTTAIEWLVDRLEHFGNKHELQVSWATVDELVEQAKEMESLEKIDNFNDGWNHCEKYLENYER